MTAPIFSHSALSEGDLPAGEQSRFDRLFKAFGGLNCQEELRPFFYSEFNEEGRLVTLPKETASQWREAFRKCAMQSLAVAEAVGPALDLFRQKQIPAIPLKGILLEAVLYEKPGSRPFCDADLWVSPGQFREAASLLIEGGYRCEAGFLLRRPGLERIPSLAFRPESGPDFPIDLHQSLLDGPGAKAVVFSSSRLQKMAALFESAPHIADERSPTGLRWPWEETLLSLTLHFYRNDYRGDKWLLDLALVFDRLESEIDFKRLRRLSDESGASRLLSAACAALFAKAGEWLPAQAAAFCSDSAGRLSKRQLRWLDGKGAFNGKRLALSFADSPGRKLAALGCWAAPSRAYLESHCQKPIPLHAWPLHVVRRWREMI